MRSVAEFAAQRFAVGDLVGLEARDVAGELEVPLGYAGVGDRVRVAIRAGDILLAAQRPAGLSARNILQGTIESLEVRGAMVACRVNAGAMFMVHVTPGALRALELATGKRVWLVIKTHSCHLVDQPSQP